MQGNALEVTDETGWSAAEAAAFANPLLDNAAHFIPASRRSTRLSLLKVRRSGDLIGVAPLLVFRRYRGTRLLRPELRAWADPWLGRLTAQTQAWIDPAFLGYAHTPPFILRDPADAGAVRAAIIAHVQARRDIAGLTVTEPAADPATLGLDGFRSFLQLPLVLAMTEGCASMDDYLARLSPKRRRNLRSERDLFAHAGGRMQVHPPGGPDARLIDRMHVLLSDSARANTGTEIPYSILMNDYPAFRTQRFWSITAHLGDAVVGFFAFIPHGGVLHQVHGGLDYEAGPAVKVYPNLMHAAVAHAIETGARAVSFGPFNNEAKRRAGAALPVMSSVWVRNRLQRRFLGRFLRRMDAYRGRLPAGIGAGHPLRPF